jgi:hypothetical protein
MANDRADELPSIDEGRGNRRRKFTMVELLVVLLLLFLITPFIEDLQYGNLIELLLLTATLLSALLAIAGRRRNFVLAVVLLTPMLAGKWYDHFQPGHRLLPVFTGTGLLFLAFVVVNLLQFVLRAPRVDAEVLCAGISIYLLLGLLWASAYVLVARCSPETFAFNRVSTPPPSMDGFTAFYFSFTTLSTVGFGDITPVSKPARMLAMMEAIVGLFYIAIFVARLVSIYSTVRPRSNGPGASVDAKIRS